MRRIYESDAVHRDEDDRFSPGKRTDSTEPQSMRSVPGATLSRWFVPTSVCYRAISIDVRTPRETFPPRTSVPFTVTMKNSMPFPLEIPTQSPILWNWEIDGVPEASRVPLHDPPDETGAFTFERGERKRFTQRWDQVFRISDSEWEPVDCGEFTISASINVEDPKEKGLYGETTIRVESE